jgi:hypothetical protein
MRSTEELLQLKEQAIALRRAGKSRRQIKESLGSMSNTTLSWALKGEPPHLSYGESRKRSAEGVRRYWAAERPVREAAREATIVAAAMDIGELTARELLIAGAIAYWCEGAKGRPRQRSDRVVFINSDPRLIRFFLRFLDAVGIERDKLTYRVYIHESADIPAAERFWADVADVDPAQFKRSVAKRHNPKTIRKNIGEDYHGCLVIAVPRSAELYQKIEGWACAAMCAQTEHDDVSN